MAKVRTIQSALNAGELSPRLRGRTDIPRYQHGLETCQNAIPMVWGGAQRTPGTRFVAQASGSVVRLIDFPASIGGVLSGYVVELGNLKLRIYHNGSRIDSAELPYELVTPYPSTILQEIRYTASANVLYLFHPQYKPRRMYRGDSDTDWTIEEVPFTYLPFMRPPNSETITMQPSATSGTITLTTDQDWFVSGHVGVQVGINKGICTITAVLTPKTATATVNEVIPYNPDDIFISDNVTIHYVPPTIPVAWNYDIAVGADFQNKILGTFPAVIMPDGVTVTKTRTVNNLVGTGVDKEWTEQAWSDRLGWPACGTFFEQRLVVGGSPAFPTYEWGSKSGDPLTFTIGTLDSDAFAFNLSAATTSIFHVRGLDSIVTFTGDREITVRGGNDSALTPTNVQTKNRTPHGSGLVAPVQIGGEIYFVTASGRKLRAFGYQYSTDSYVAGDVALVADHLVTGGNGIREMVYAREPYSLLWAITNNGDLLTVTLDKEQEVTAWAIHSDPDAIYSGLTAVMGVDGIEQVWFAVRRLVGGQWLTYVEMLDDFQTRSTVTKTGSALTELTGLNHLEGRLVDIIADGFYCGRQEVSGGKVTLTTPADYIEAGLPYQTVIKDLPLELNNPGQSIQGAACNVNKIRVRLHETQGCSVNGEKIPFRSFPYINIPVAPFTGDKKVTNLGGGTDPAMTQVTIVQDLPFNVTVLAIIKDVAING